MSRVMKRVRPREDADPATPMFTFACGTSKPEFRVTCHHCGWRVGGPHGTYAEADTHVCDRGSRAGLARDEAPAPRAKGDSAR